ncbi:hypothetical protein EJ06DRAFT_529296 [Trichodelitschia bisporula]|uniref:Uncharacterized protein n=1 Tax=Trichodelitschia bisporula TaxID=703511 RepID=A0A6G1HYQ5_9PEZI|nr:hypothetical protein EJ06DRAFT_529296 [Trichodelitschia bisporula]
MAEIASPDFPGARRRKIRYGPYRVPPTTEKSLESQWLGDQGMMTSIQLGAKKPCTTNCVIMKISGSIEYADGTSADTGTGAWFHHAALINIGTTVRDPVCGQKYVEDLFMSGNERSEAIYSFPRSSVKAGYHLLMQDMFMLNAELLNMDANEKWVWMTLTYDILDGEHPEYKDGKVVWMNIGPALCGTTANPFGASNVTKTYQPTARKFEEKSIPWVIPVDGQILGSTGHMHDGALGMDFFHDGKKICTSTSLYSKTAKGVMMGGPGASSNSSAGAMPGGHSHGRRQIMGGNYNNKDIEHIAQQIPCLYEPPVKIRKGEKLWIAANYDYDTHPGMKNDKGEIDQAMGIAGTIIALPYPRQV